MKMRIITLVIAVFAISDMAQAGLWVPAILNPSFESVQNGADHSTLGGWGYVIDDWFEDENGGSTRNFWEKGADIGLAGDGDLWAGTETNGAFYQAIGTVDDGAVYEVTMLIGSRNGTSFNTGSVSLFAGGTEADGGDAVLLESFATVLDSVQVTVADGTEVGTNVYEVTVELTIGTGHAGELMWLQVKSVAGKDYFDNIRIVGGPDAIAKLPDPMNNAQKVNSDQLALSWVAPGDYVALGYDVYLGTDSNELSPNYLRNFKVADNVDSLAYGPVDLEYNTTYFWAVDAYEPNEPGAPVRHTGEIWTFTTATHPSQFHSTSVVNPSFESVSDPGNNWGYEADDWFEWEDGGRSFWEIGTSIQMPNCDGLIWAGIDLNCAYYQPIGDVAGQVFDVHMLTGWRNDWNPQPNTRTEVSLYAGGTIADAADGTDLASFATKIDSVEYAIGDLEPLIGSDNEFVLNTQLYSGGAIGETLWVQIKTVAGGRTYFDNITVEAVNSLGTNSAWGPNVSPMDEEGLISTTGALLSWNTGVDVDNNYEPDAAIVAHHIYLSRDRDAVINSDSSAYRGSQLASDTDYEPAAQGEALISDSIYYWMIVEELNTGTKIPGMCWSFGTEKLLAVVLEEPMDAVIDPGTTAELSVLVDTATAEDYTWYRLAEGGDVEVGYERILNIGEAGVYYCKIHNNAGDVYSQTAIVTIKQLMGHWTFDGNLVSTVNAAHTGTVDIDRYTSDSVSGQAWEFLADPNVIVIENSVEDFNFYPLGYTVSAWVKTTQTGWGAYVAKQDKTGGNKGFVLTHADNAGITTLRESFNDLSSGDVGLADGAWHYVVGTFNAQTGLGQVFVDGVLRNTSGESFPNLTLHGEPLFFGGETTGGAVAFVGLLDEVKIWNYALDAYEVAGEYTAIRTDESICIEYDYFDVNKDCFVDLVDFAAFAEAWMGCNMVPCVR